MSADVEGWLTPAQARALAVAAGRARPGERIVEIGSFRGRSTIALAAAAAPGVEVVAIDPHLGAWREPHRTTEDADLGQADVEAFRSNLARAGVAERVRHVRRFSGEALGDVEGEVAVLFIDGAHDVRGASADVVQWGGRVAPGGRMLVHDAFSSVGVTLALARLGALGRTWRYVGRTGSLAEYVREDLAGAARLRNAARHLVELPWFVRNLAVKALIVARLKPLARLLGHRDGPWPY
ncbi:MAG TPA: class I SAM-dependent methyltransferase [Solirubrobacteraceae bacterium]|nr:class I SAM-dependent methyltransferase [Solirubrobacteraceae bacterium]